jgi:hypothetical protein
VNASRRGWLVAAGVVVMLLALVVVGRLQGRNLAASDAGASRATRATVGTDDAPVTSGLAAGPYARGLSGGGILLRVDPASGRVAGWLRDPRWFFREVLAAGPRGVWVGTAAPELLHVVAA